MVNNPRASTFEISETTISRSTRWKVLRDLPKSWIVAGIIFYCASVLTVGLLAGLLPQRKQYITIMGTPTQTSTSMKEKGENEIYAVNVGKLR